MKDLILYTFIGSFIAADIYFLVMLNIYHDNEFYLFGLIFCFFAMVISAFAAEFILSNKKEALRSNKTLNNMSDNFSDNRKIKNDNERRDSFSYSAAGITDERVYYNFIEENRVMLNLFLRPYTKKSIITLANKYLVLEIDINAFVNSVGKISVINKEEKTQKGIGISLLADKTTFSVFYDICNLFSYETREADIEEYMESNNIHCFESKAARSIKVSLDINTASEAELTALPGVTIARAKHAIKERKEHGKFITMNNFYTAINLEEEFIEQIPVKRNKVILDELIQYKKIEKQW